MRDEDCSLCLRTHQNFGKGTYTMKKYLALILALLMVTALFAGCTKGGETTGTPAPAANNGIPTSTSA